MQKKWLHDLTESRVAGGEAYYCSEANFKCEAALREVVIVEALRSPIGKRGGGLSALRPDELAAQVIQSVVQNSGVDGAAVDDLIVGCVTQVGEQGWNVGRLAGLLSGLPAEVPAFSLNRMCGSGQQAVHSGCQAIASGDMDLVVAGGVESMSRVKMGSDGKDFSPALLEKYDLVWQGTSAELLSSKFALRRSDLDEFALESHRKALASIDAGRFDAEVCHLETGGNGGRQTVVRDEGPRFDTSAGALAALKPAFQEDGVVTAGNSSQISDGAAFILLASQERASELGLRARARIISRVVVGSDPVLMLDGVIPATRKALEKAGLSTGDIDVFEINEAFACVPLAWMKELEIPREKVNPSGGAIALGHPLGASGARLMITLLNELERTGKRFGLQTMCIGHGMATATVIERLG